MLQIKSLKAQTYSINSKSTFKPGCFMSKGKYTFCYLLLKALLAKISLDCNVLGLHFS